MMMWKQQPASQMEASGTTLFFPLRAEGPLPQPVEQPPPGQVAEEEEEEEEEEVATLPPVPAQASQRGEVGTLSPESGAPTSGYPARVRKKYLSSQISFACKVI